jgi:nitrite reductase/ring-hydroxylating ferredoxin subunit
MAPDLQDGRHRAVSETVSGPAVLCRLDAIEDGEGKGFTRPDGREIFVVRDGASVYGYLNSCPHQGTPLDWTPDRFISADSGLIMCATHGAQFEIADGLCVSGPCEGDRLTPVPVAVDGQGRVVLSDGT